MQLLVNSEPIRPKYNLLGAITALALAARIHNSDKAVMATGYRLLGDIAVQYRPIILNIMNSVSPLAHMNTYVATLPDHILERRQTLQVKKPA